MKVCPLCNGLNKIHLYCPQCKEPLEDSGMIENFFAPYNPYLAQDILETLDNTAADECMHLFTCPRCGYDQRQTIKKEDP